MPTQETITLFKYDELPSEAAKEKAREWVAQGEGEDFSEFAADCVTEDFERICGILGVELKTQTQRTMGGKEYQKPCIYWSGFWSQGDGASFEGSYSYKKGACKAIREYAPEDKELHKIADALRDLERSRFYKIDVKISQSGRYCHEHSMDFELMDSRTGDYAEMTFEQAKEWGEPFRDLARWLYRALEKEYEYRTGDKDHLEETLRANEYDFEADGTRWRH